jgi:ABC-2 type transport system ATP-binding protein
MSFILELQDVAFSYPKDVQALCGLSMNIAEGKMTAILGPNGSGKSTLFKLLSGLVKAQQGQILFHQKPLAQQRDVFQASLGLVFQHTSLDPLLTVDENLFLQAALHGMSQAQASQRIQTLCDAFELQDRRQQRVKTLSGGLARRVEIAKALVHQPQLLLLDEPSTGLDPKARMDLFQWVRSIVERWGTTVVWITHLAQEAQKMDEVVILDHGRSVVQASPDLLTLELDFVTIAAVLDDVAMGDQLMEGLSDVTLIRDRLTAKLSQEESQQWVAKILPYAQQLEVKHATLEDVYLHKTGKQFI